MNSAELTLLSKYTPSARRRSAFSLIESLVAIGISIIALTGFYGSSGQAMRVLRSGRQTVSASQILQERIETFRTTTRWSSITTPQGITALVTNATSSAANFPAVTETFTVVAYPTAGTPIVVTRSANGTITSSGSTLATQSGVKLTVQATWTGNGTTSRTRQLATILTSGGL